MKLAEFRSFSKVIDIEECLFIEKEKDELDIVWGLYFKGVKGDYLSFYVLNKKAYLKYNYNESEEFDIVIFNKCILLSEYEWRLTFRLGIEKIIFDYKTFYLDEVDGEDKTDVNFGLWLLSLKFEKDKLERVIKACSI